MLRNLLKQQAEYIRYFFDHVDTKKGEEILQKLLQCQGIIFCIGVGKSGIIAQKLAATLSSTGTKAIYLSPTDAMHGDVGLVSPGDICILISKSGETEEILVLMPYLRNKGATLIAFVSEKETRLEYASDLSILLPVQKELCPFDLAPTVSVEVHLIFCDALAAALMHLKNFSIEEFAKNHPAGKIGKKITLRVKDLMRKGRKLPICSPESKLLDTLPEFSKKGCGCLLIVDEEQKLLGIFTDGDLRRSVEKKQLDLFSCSLKELMIVNPRTITEDYLVWDAMKIMEENPKHPISVMPVVRQEKLVGLIRMHDIIQSGL